MLRSASWPFFVVVGLLIAGCPPGGCSCNGDGNASGGGQGGSSASSGGGSASSGGGSASSGGGSASSGGGSASSGGGSASSGGGSAGGGSGGGVVDAGHFEEDAGAVTVLGLDGGSCVTVTPACLGRPNLLRNSDFEAVPDAGGDGVEGILPDEWFALQVTPDTYTTVGGYGLVPTTFGNFQDTAAAHSGNRWIAAWSSADERGGQQLSAPLIPGHTYRAEAYLQQASRSDLDYPGTYTLLLADDATQTNLQSLGQWCPTTAVDAGWSRRAFTFVATDAGTAPWLVFKPESSVSAYPGLDDFQLTDVTGCAP